MPRKPKVKQTFNELLEGDFSDYYIDAENDSNEIIDVIPTGSVSLDVSIGIGGIPLGRFTEIYGPESSGKTTLVLALAKNALDRGYNVLYVDPEQGVGLGIAKRVIGDIVENPERFILIQPETMEQALGICEAAVESGDFSLIILDSIGSMSPQKVKVDALEDANVSLLARRLTTWLQRNAFKVRYNQIAFVGVNQVRDAIGSYVKYLETPGGHYWKHITSLRIQLNKVDDIKKDEDKIGIQTKFVVKKSKVGPPMRSWYFPIMFADDYAWIDKTRDVVEFAKNMGVIVCEDKHGSYYYFDGQSVANGFEKTVEALRDNKELLDKVENACYNLVRSKRKEVESG